MKQGLVQQLNSNVANLEAEKARLGSIFKPDHPRMQELNQQILAARQAFNSEITNVVRGIKSNYAAAAAKERGLESEAAKQQGDALRLRELGVNYTLLEEDVKANRSLYESVLKRLSETNVSNDLAISNMQIAEKAAMPGGSSGPNVGLYLLASMVSGLFLGVGVAFLREFADSSIGTPEDVWRSVGLGTLGVVPYLKLSGMRTSAGGLIDRVYPRHKEASKLLPPPDSAAKDLVVSDSPLSMVSESYRAIRTSLLLSQAEKPPQVILVTSPSPGEGKTVSSLNLSIALAQDGYSVLLVDADLRKGCCHERLGLRSKGGLSNVLTGRLSLQEGIQQTLIERLSLMSRGEPPPNPSELLGSPIMKKTLNDLRDIYDFILIDSPPVIGISDAAILSVAVDGVLLVLDGRSTSTPRAQTAVERLDMVRARMLGVILNGVDLRDPHYSYFRSYNLQGAGAVERARQRPARHLLLPPRLCERQGARLRRNPDAGARAQPRAGAPAERFALHAGDQGEDRGSRRDRALRRLARRRRRLERGLHREAGRHQGAEDPLRGADLRRHVAAGRRLHRVDPEQRGLQRAADRGRRCDRYERRQLRLVPPLRAGEMPDGARRERALVHVPSRC